MKTETIIVYIDDSSTRLPEDFEADIDNLQTTVLHYNDKDARTCHEIYLVDKSGSATQVIQAKRGVDNPAILLSHVDPIQKLGNMELNSEERAKALRLRDTWKVAFYKGFVVTRQEVTSIKDQLDEMRKQNVEMLRLKDDHHRERIDEINKNAEERIQLAKDEKEIYKQNLINVTKDAARSQLQGLETTINIIASQARANMGKAKFGSKLQQSTPQAQPSQASPQISTQTQQARTQGSDGNPEG